MTPTPFSDHAAPATAAAPFAHTPLADAHPHSGLSALMDGDAQALQPACSLWRDDAGARQTWHTYHLIGDVLRSDELASTAQRDAAFLQRLRSQLATELVLLAPTPTPTPSQPRRQAWLLPAAVAAGFMAVAGVLLVTQGGLPAAAPAAGMLATSQDLQATTPAQAGAAQRRLVSEQGVLRDARLDEYLRAHQAARGGFGAALPGGALRRVDVVVPASPER